MANSRQREKKTQPGGQVVRGFMGNVILQVLTSSYINCRVRADFPTPPLPTMITLWRTRDVWFLFLPEAMTVACGGRGGGGEVGRGDTHFYV